MKWDGRIEEEEEEEDGSWRSTSSSFDVSVNVAGRRVRGGRLRPYVRGRAAVECGERDTKQQDSLHSSSRRVREAAPLAQ